MQEFSAISVSSYEAGSLADRLTEQSRDGWSVVAIVPTGSTVTAYLCREAQESGAAAAAEEPVIAAAVAEPVAEPAAEPVVETEPTAVPVVPMVAEPVEEPAAEPAAAEATPVSTTESFTVTDTAAATDTAATAAAASAGAAPAGWYADPSGRFELRYWDGGQWTEHVSRAGQQYTDPPVA